jgi:hypothetical protein
VNKHEIAGLCLGFAASAARAGDWNTAVHFVKRASDAHFPGLNDSRTAEEREAPTLVRGPDGVYVPERRT